MKTKLCFIVICLIYNINYSQSKEDDFNFYLQSLFNIIKNKESDKLFDSFYPKMQSQIPREQVSQFLGDLYTNPNFETNMDNFKILKIGNIVKRGNNFYVLVDYSAETNIFFTKDASDEFIEKAKNHFKELYNERYSYNDSDKVIVTSRDFEILVINENNIWSHIPGIVKLRPYLNYWIEEDVIEEIFE